MKNIVFSLMFIITIQSCDILDLKPLDKISETDTWTDQALMQLYINGTYQAIPHGFRQDVLAAATDETYCIHNYGSLYQVQQGAMTQDNVGGLSGNINYWSNAYKNIRNINIFFTKIDNSPVDENFKKGVTGEMKFLRAYIYANMIWRYGGVPLITKVFELNEDYSFARNSYSECVDFIIAELDEAIKLLPAKQPSGQLGRASGDACHALKSRVLLYAASELNNPDHNNAKWQKAAEATEVLLGKYSLLDDYQSIFLADNNEIIFSRSFTQANSTDYHLWNGRNGSNGWTAQNPTQNLVDAFEMSETGMQPYTEQSGGALIVNPESGYDPKNPYFGRDPRFYATILYDGSMWQGRETETWHGGLDSPESDIGSWNASKTAYAIKKFIIESIPSSGSTQKPTNPWIFFRYTELLLNYAEAKFELGDEATAREYLNKIRLRPSVNMPLVSDTGEKLRKCIQNERRIELVFEEHRFFDVRRWKIAMDTENQDLSAMNIQKLPDGTKTYQKDMLLRRSFLKQHYLIPIPKAEIDRSLNALTQNPDY